jgi:spore germination protein KA
MTSFTKKVFQKKSKLQNNRDDNSSLNGIDEEMIKGIFYKSADVKFLKIDFETVNYILVFYCEQISNFHQSRELLLKNIYSAFDYKNSENLTPVKIGSMLHMKMLENKITADQIESKIFNGSLLVFVEKFQVIYELEMFSPPSRDPEESNDELSIRGPRDGFTEEIRTNVALIRKRLKTNSLHYEKFVLGKTTKTKIGILYIEDKANNNLVNSVKKRLSNLDIDGIYTSSQLEEMLSDSKYSLFPLLGYTGRPDYATQCLLNGRIVIITDGSPSVLIAPANLTFILKSAEEKELSFWNTSWGRILRLATMIISMILPGFWISIVAFHQNYLPFPLLASINTQRLGIPLTVQLEMFLVLFLFEIFKEAGTRMPKQIGSSVTVIGGIIIGDAAIRSGLASASLILIASISAIAAFTIINQVLSGAISILRIIILLLSSLFGAYGFFLSVFGIILYLSSLTSFGIPYLAPLESGSIFEISKSILKLPWTVLSKHKTQFLSKSNSSRKRN